jgi:hypothetical protein
MFGSAGGRSGLDPRAQAGQMADVRNPDSG